MPGCGELRYKQICHQSFDLFTGEDHVADNGPYDAKHLKGNERSGLTCTILVLAPIDVAIRRTRSSNARMSGPTASSITLPSCLALFIANSARSSTNIGWIRYCPDPGIANMGKWRTNHAILLIRISSLPKMTVGL